MLLYETKLAFAYPCRSKWPHCNTGYCRWGRYGTTEITNTNAIAATSVSQGSHTLYKTQGNGLSVEKQGNLREITKQLREFLTIAKSQAILRLRYCFWQCYVVFSHVLPSVSRQNHWKNKPFTNSPRVNICNTYIYMPMVNWWIACIQLNNGVHFHFMKILMLWT